MQYQDEWIRGVEMGVEATGATMGDTGERVAGACSRRRPGEDQRIYGVGGGLEGDNGCNNGGGSRKYME